MTATMSTGFRPFILANDLTPPPLPVDWHEGMLLSPEHLQQMADRIDALAQFYLGQVMPFHWGVLAFDFDKMKLAQGTLRVDRLDAVMPDGLVISGAGLEGELQLDLKSHEADFQHKAARVYVIAAKSRGYARDRSRYRSVESHEGADPHDGDELTALPLLAPKLELSIHAPASSRYIGLPLIEIELNADGFCPTSYQPPVARLQRAEVLMRDASSLAVEIRKKALAILEEGNSPSSQRASISTQSSRSVFAAICAELPVLESIIDCPASTPNDLFQSLLRLAGQLAVLNDITVPPAFGSYRHDDPQACIKPTINYILSRLRSIQMQTKEILFKRLSERFELTIQPDWCESGSLLIGLRTAAGGQTSQTNANGLAPNQTQNGKSKNASSETAGEDMNPDAVARWLNTAIIAPLGDVERHIANRTVGFDRARVHQEGESKMAGHGGLILFRVSIPSDLAVDTVLTISNRFAGRSSMNNTPQTEPSSVALIIANTQSEPLDAR